MDADAVRTRALVEESREAVVVVDERDRVLFASRRARQSLDGVREGDRLPEDLLSGGLGIVPLVVRYEVDGRWERLVYFSEAGDLAAYEELRSGFTAAVSHELRTPLARLLTLLETAALPGEDVPELVAQATREVEQITELIDEVLFLTELESGARVVTLGASPVRPVVEEVFSDVADRATRAGVTLRIEGDDVELAIRPRMLRVVVRNLAENAIRHAGPFVTFTLALEQTSDGTVVVAARDDGVGVPASELPRLFERFYRSDRARASRGTGLGLAIVKHVVAQAGGTVEARRGAPRGLEIRCAFPPRS